MGEKKRNRKRRIIINIIMVLSIGVFLFSGYKLYSIYSEYEKGDAEYEMLQEMAVKINTPSGEAELEDAKEEPVYVVDFDKLREVNPDVIGWIRFDEPSKISYPLVKGKDNEKYLSVTFEGKKNSVGTLFVDYRNASDFESKNTFIYGHNMKNGAMFGQLKKYKEKSFCEENPYFYIYTLDGKESTYRVFACSVVKDTSESYNMIYNDETQFLEYINHIKKSSRYIVDIEVNAESKIVSLSTCTNAAEDERILVHGVKVLEK